MRLLHFADLHLGVERYGRPVAGRGWLTHTDDIISGFDFLVEYALESGVDAVIFAGDAFKSREPSQTQQREFASRILRLSQAGIPVYLLTGNHDLPNAEGRAHALELYRTLHVPNVYIGDNSWFREHGFVPRVIETRSGPLQIAAIPWPQVSAFVGYSDEAKDMELGRLQQRVAEEINKLVQQQTEALDPDVPAILTAHITVDDWIVRENPGSEQLMTGHNAPAILPSVLHASAFDYVALGHHHNNMELSVTAPAWYAGSLHPIDFGDEGLKKGFMVLDIDPNKGGGRRTGGSGAPQLVEVPHRAFKTIDAMPQHPDPTMEVVERIRGASIKDCVVRVRATMTRAQETNLRRDAVRDALGAAHHVAGISIETPREQRMKLPAGTQPDSLNPIEALDLYLRAKEYPAERRDRLVNTARGLVASVQEKH